MVLVHQLGFHILYTGGPLMILFLLRGLGHRRRGLPFFHGWLPIVRFLSVFAICLTGWELLPWRWQLPLIVVFFLVCMGLLFRDALRQGAPLEPPSTKAGKGAA